MPITENKILQENQDGTQVTYRPLQGTGVTASALNNSINKHLKRLGVYNDNTESKHPEVFTFPINKTTDRSPRYSTANNVVHLPNLNNEAYDPKMSLLNDFPSNYKSWLMGVDQNKYIPNFYNTIKAHEGMHWWQAQKGNTDIERHKALRQLAATSNDKLLHNAVQERNTRSTHAANILYGNSFLAGGPKSYWGSQWEAKYITPIRKEYKHLLKSINRIIHKDVNQIHPEDLNFSDLSKNRRFRDFGKDNVEIKPQFGDSWMRSQHLDHIHEATGHDPRFRNALFRWKPYKGNEDSFDISEETPSRYDEFMKLSDNDVINLFKSGKLSIEDYDAIMRGRERHKRMLEEGGGEAIDNYKNIILPLSFNFQGDTHKTATTHQDFAMNLKSNRFLKYAVIKHFENANRSL